MNITNSVLSDVRGFLNVGRTNTAFDCEIIPHVMASLGKLSQNGVGVPTVISDTSTSWVDVIKPEMVDNPEIVAMVPLYVMMSTKLMFDPPPPSAIEYHKNNMDELLWRLRLVYDTKEVDNNGET